MVSDLLWVGPGHTRPTHDYATIVTIQLQWYSYYALAPSQQNRQDTMYFKEEPHKFIYHYITCPDNPEEMLRMSNLGNNHIIISVAQDVLVSGWGGGR